MEELAPRELVANQYPGDEEAGHGVVEVLLQTRGRSLSAAPTARGIVFIPQARGAERRRAQDQDREGKKDDEAEIGQRIGERDGKPRIALGRRKPERIGCTSSSVRTEAISIPSGWISGLCRKHPRQRSASAEPRPSRQNTGRW